MKESPILFNGDMVRAILDGRKTQTRRIVKGLPVTAYSGIAIPDKCVAAFLNEPSETRLDAYEIKYPLGKVGDRLWVRETWRTYKTLDHLPPRSIEPGVGIQYEVLGTNLPGDNGDFLLGMGKIRPSIFMPKWAARIWLEITDVRVERLHSISEADAGAEGLTKSSIDSFRHGLAPYVAECAGTPNRPAAYAFRELWMSLYGADAFESNPWVWAITFKRVTP